MPLSMTAERELGRHASAPPVGRVDDDAHRAAAASRPSGARRRVRIPPRSLYIASLAVMTYTFFSLITAGQLVWGVVAFALLFALVKLARVGD